MDRQVSLAVVGVEDEERAEERGEDAATGALLAYRCFLQFDSIFLQINRSSLRLNHSSLEIDRCSLRIDFLVNVSRPQGTLGPMAKLAHA